MVASALDEKGNETTAGARPPSAVPDRFIAYVFDDIHLEAGDLLTARSAADRHLSESLGLGSRAAIFTTSGRVVLDFTDDRDKLQETLNRIQPLAYVRESTSVWTSPTTGRIPSSTSLTTRL